MTRWMDRNCNTYGLKQKVLRSHKIKFEQIHTKCGNIGTARPVTEKSRLRKSLISVFDTGFKDMKFSDYACTIAKNLTDVIFHTKAQDC